MKLYHAKRTRSFRVLWMLEEMGLPYELQVVAFPPTGDAEFMAVNPLGTLPAFVDGPVVMTESVAVLEYLGRRHGPTPLAPQPESQAYGAYLEYLHFGEATLTAALSAMIRTRFMAPEADRDNWTARAIGDQFKRKAAHLETVLAVRPYLAGDDFTAADISNAYGLRLAGLLGLTADYGPALTAYLARLQDRPAYKRADAL